jgi:hypothetical protein
LIKKIIAFLTKPVDIFSFDYKEVKAYLDKLPEPKSLLHRSFLQYKSQKFYQNKTISFVKNSGAFFLLAPYVILLWFKGIFFNQNGINAKVVFVENGTKNLIPKELQTRFSTIKGIPFNSNKYLRTSDLGIVINALFRHPGHFFFHLKNVFNLARYRYIVDYYTPETIICTSEYSFSSSLMTSFCEKNRITHINIMHGEKMFNIRDSFFKYHECFVWDNYYKDLFTNLRASKDQFSIARPKSLHIKQKEKNIQYEYTYYLANENLENLINIRDNLERLKVDKAKIAIRPHPIYSNVELVTELFSEFVIQKSSVSIADSIKISKNLVSLYSTVLLQGYFSNVNIIIDDTSNVNKYNRLKELDYILISKNTPKLSSIIEI